MGYSSGFERVQTHAWVCGGAKAASGDEVGEGQQSRDEGRGKARLTGIRRPAPPKKVSLLERSATTLSDGKPLPTMHSTTPWPSGSASSSLPSTLPSPTPPPPRRRALFPSSPSTSRLGPNRRSSTVHSTRCRLLYPLFCSIPANPRWHHAPTAIITNVLHVQSTIHFHRRRALITRQNHLLDPHATAVAFHHC